ncbi:hypothetical protein J4E08_10020 [Sagittula sp. NFXS13]|uniref:DUF6527 family protein n=1 Tax=Sagittula sp. NFXS13 TaxID=2819095 RepID=UPI0032DF3536
MTLRAISMPNKASLSAAALPGSFWVPEVEEGGRTMLHFICPCGCGVTRAITVGHRHKPKMCGASWNWNASRSEPTLTPSVNARPVGGCNGWHGYLRNGYWEAC